MVQWLRKHIALIVFQSLGTLFQFPEPTASSSQTPWIPLLGSDTSFVCLMHRDIHVSHGLMATPESTDILTAVCGLAIGAQPLRSWSGGISDPASTGSVSPIANFWVPPYFFLCISLSVVVSLPYSLSLWLIFVN